jgi:hypothetical protein
LTMGLDPYKLNLPFLFLLKEKKGLRFG